MMRTVARTAAIAGTATAVNGRVARRQSAKFAQQDAAAAAAAAPAPAPAAPPQAAPAAAEPAGITDDLVEQLKRLAELREQGILTDEEFAAQKAKLLA
jgi:hypothetical protein